MVVVVWCAWSSWSSWSAVVRSGSAFGFFGFSSFFAGFAGVCFRSFLRFVFGCFGRFFAALRDDFVEPGGAFAQRLLQGLIDPAEGVDLAARSAVPRFRPRRIRRSVASCFTSSRLEVISAGGVSRQQLGAAAASAGGER